MTTEKKRTGFATMDAERRREVASAGGKACHRLGKAHKFDKESASIAGKVAHERGTAHHWSSEEARAAGRKGGRAQRRGRGVEAPPEAIPSTEREKPS
jgi:general stress protein YciG